jgi:flagellar biosynthesis protein FlhA
MIENTFMLRLKSQAHLIAPLAVLASIFIIMVPLPPVLLDLCYTFNLILSITILLTSTYLKQAVDFSVYPSLLLLSTLFRLSLNLASARLILLHGEEGIFAAGKVIGSFGSFVLGGNFVIGIIVFIIILAVQWLIVAGPSTRAAEVAARFTLDKMPGKQLSIDADLNAGLITEAEAVERRKQLEREAEFFGTMDGAIRFSAHEPKVSMIVIIVNIVGGLLVGLFQKNMDFSTALQNYTTLTVGDGMLAALPSLFVAISAGIIATRATSDQSLGADILQQMIFNYKPLLISSITILLFALIPGLPKVPFFVLGGFFAFLAYQVRKQQGEEVVEKKRIEDKVPPPPPEKIEALLKVDMVGLEIGYGLIQLVDEAQGGSLLQRIKAMRKQLALDMGVIIPPVRIRDNLQLGSREYAILIKGSTIAKGEVMASNYLAINPGNIQEKLKGIESREPAFGLQAYWIGEEEREHAQFLGYTLVDPATVISTHLTEILKGHAHELLGRQETQHLVETLATSYPKVVEELIPAQMSLGAVQKVLQSLLKERVSILDLRSILETLADYAPFVKDLNVLTELVRQSLARSLTKPYITPQNELPVVVLGAGMENALGGKIQKINNTDQLVIQPEDAQSLLTKIRQIIEKTGIKVQPIILCSSQVRYHVRQLLERFMPEVVILSAAEVPANIRIVSLGVIE